MTNQDQLTSLAAEFEQWYLTRKHPRAKTPQSLKDKTVALAQHYSASQIKAAINIADSTFHNWRQQALSTHNTSANQTSEFIAIPDGVSTTPDEIKLAITSKNGHQLQLFGTISPELLAVITGALLA